MLIWCQKPKVVIQLPYCSNKIIDNHVNKVVSTFFCIGKDQLHICNLEAVHLRLSVAIYSSYQIISNIQHIQSWDLLNGPLKWHLEILATSH